MIGLSTVCICMGCRELKQQVKQLEDQNEDMMGIFNDQEEEIERLEQVILQLQTELMEKEDAMEIFADKQG